MYRKVEDNDRSESNFELPSEVKLCEHNRWVMLAKLIPWSEFEQAYALNFSEEMGAPAKPFRMALGALIIKEKLGISDRETVEQIRENPYLQYFIGLDSYSNEAPFDASMMVHFRQRITLDLVKAVTEKLVKSSRETREKSPKKKSERESVVRNENRGKLLIDATVAPADIRYPTDVGLLNKVRQQTEKVIDILYKSIKEKLDRKPRTYRKLARKDYLKIAKNRRPSRKQRRKAQKKQLQYIQRNLREIDQLIEKGAKLSSLSRRQYRRFLVVNEILRQQKQMWESSTEKIEDRIVSLTQPHIRPIVRGKAGATTEFGAKLSACCFEGYVLLGRISWDNYNESKELKSQIESYKELTGFYPESVHVDRIYRTRENRAWCKERGIRISGPPLGRPRKNLSKQVKKQAQEDERIRNEIEGKFGIVKRRFGLNRVMAKLDQTSQTVVAITFLVMNLSHLLRQIYSPFLCQISPARYFWPTQLYPVISDRLKNNFSLSVPRTKKLLYSAIAC